MKKVAEQLWRHEQKWCWLIALSSSVITHGFSIFRSHFMRRQEYTLNPNLFEDCFCHKSNCSTASSALLISVWVIYWIPKPIQTYQLSSLHCVVKKSLSACLRGKKKSTNITIAPFSLVSLQLSLLLFLWMMLFRTLPNFKVTAGQEQNLSM